MNNKSLLTLILTAITFIGGYAFLRYAYKVTDHFPFTQEIVLIVLGTVATVLITALLLNKQTAVEVEKEQAIKFLELKTNTYEQLIHRIEEMSMAKTITEEDLMRMRFITHRLAIFSSPAVLAEYHQFLSVLGDSTEDGNISNDLVPISNALAKLTIAIRADLLGESDALSGHSQDSINNMILKNVSESSDLQINP